MLPAAVAYEAPTSLDEALAVLARDPTAVVLGASPRTVIDLKLRRIAPSVLLDISGLAALRGISHDPDGTRIGSLTTLRALQGDAGAGAHTPLSLAATFSGDPQMRNMETVLGCLTRDLATSAVAAALLVLDAGVELAGSGGSRTIPVSTLIADGPKQGELAVAVRLRAPSGRGSYAQQAHAATLDPVCGIAGWVATDAGGRVEACRLAVVGATPMPARLTAAEASVVGRPLTVDAIDDASQAASEGVDLLSDAAASGTYRRSLVATYVGRVLGSLAAATDRGS